MNTKTNSSKKPTNYLKAMKNIGVAIMFILCCVTATAQRIDTIMANYAEAYPQQKIHLHFDKEIYRAGETIFFKGYVFAGVSQSSKSTNFYCELIDKNGSVVKRHVYPIIESTSVGNFELAENFNPGNYTVRAYTTWMLNFDTAFIYSKIITVINNKGVAENSNAIAPVTKTFSLNLFPEGGDLVNTLQSVVAFKANDNFGMPVSVSGKVVDNSQKEVVAFKSRHDGMGSFTLTPEAGKTYTAVWTNPHGKVESTPLPLAKKEGIVLRLNSARDKKFYVITRTAESTEKFGQVQVVAQFAQQMVYKARVPLVNTMNSGVIPTKDLPSGVMQVTVFTQDWEPLAERIIMINNDEYTFNASISTPLVDLNKRAKNELQVQVDDSLLTNMSIAVTDAEVAANSGSDNIISRMLLTGDIKGYVHNPAYYFSNITDSVSAHLELVMLTHGWRKYNLKDVLAGVKPTLPFATDNNLSISGTVFGANGKNEIKSDESINAFLIASDSSSQLVQIPYAGNNQFNVNNLIFFDSVQVLYSFNKDKKLDKKATLKFSNKLYAGSDRVLLPAPLFFAGTDTVSLKRNLLLAQELNKYGSSWKGEGNMLQAVTVRTKVKSRLEELNDRYTTGMFNSDNGYSFDMTEASNSYSADVFTFLQGRVPGLNVSNSGGEVQVSWRNSETTFFLNEMPVDAEAIKGISILDIALVKVYRPPFFGSFGGGPGGAIGIYTKKGQEVRSRPGEGISKAVLKGYNKPKQFYSPDYSTRSASTDVVADYRTTLYWNPVVLTEGSQKKVKLTFYNNDITKAYRVVLEGVNEEGKLIRIEKIYK